MADFGGVMRFTYGGTPLVLRAKFDHEPLQGEYDGGANQDGSTFRTMKVTGYVAEPMFEDTLPSGVSWDSIFQGGPYNMTLVEDMTGVTHNWTGASFEGKPRIDRHTGEVSGVKLRAPVYKRLAS